MADISQINLPNDNNNPYNIDAVTVNSHTVNSDVPSDAKFTDTWPTFMTNDTDPDTFITSAGTTFFHIDHGEGIMVTPRVQSVTGDARITISATDYYHKGDSFSIGGGVFPIYLGSTEAQFIIPLLKKIGSDVTNISIDGKWRAIIANSNTGANSVWISNDVLTSKGTVGVTKTEMGLLVTISGTNLVSNWSMGTILSYSTNTVTLS